MAMSAPGTSADNQRPVRSGKGASSRPSIAPGFDKAESRSTISFMDGRVGLRVGTSPYRTIVTGISAPKATSHGGRSASLLPLLNVRLFATVTVVSWVTTRLMDISQRRSRMSHQECVDPASGRRGRFAGPGGDRRHRVRKVTAPQCWSVHEPRPKGRGYRGERGERGERGPPARRTKAFNEARPEGPGKGLGQDPQGQCIVFASMRPRPEGPRKAVRVLRWFHTLSRLQ